MRFKPIKFGPFPYEMVNRTIGTELEPGGVYISVRAQLHMQRDHPADFPIISRHLESVILNPTLIGQSPRHSSSFEMVKRLRIIERDENGSTTMEFYSLLALSLELDQHGDYRVESGYSLKEEQVTQRRLSGHLLPPIWR